MPSGLQDSLLPSVIWTARFVAQDDLDCYVLLTAMFILKSVVVAVPFNVVTVCTHHSLNMVMKMLTRLQHLVSSKDVLIFLESNMQINDISNITTLTFHAYCPDVLLLATSCRSFLGFIPRDS